MLQPPSLAACQVFSDTLRLPALTQLRARRRFKFRAPAFRIAAKVMNGSTGSQTPARSTDTSPSERTMNDDQLSNDIREANLSYLMLAQNLIRRDKAEALFRLGLSEDSADMIALLSPAQMIKIASSPMLLCRFRIDDDTVWGLLTNHTPGKVSNQDTARLHASILMSGRFEQAL